MKFLSPPRMKAGLHDLYEVLVLVDCDDTMLKHQGPWIERMGYACNDDALRRKLSELDWDAMGPLPKILQGKKLRPGLILPSGRITQEGDHFIEGSEPSERGVTRYEFLDPTIYDGLSLFPGVREGLAKMAAIPGVKILCVTAHTATVRNNPAHPHRSLYEQKKQELILSQIPFLTKEDILFTNDKAQFVHEKLPTLIIEDNYEHIKAVRAKRGVGILIDQPWNAAIQEREVPRVKNLLEAASYVEAFAEEVRRQKQADQASSRGPLFQYSRYISSGLSMQGVQPVRG